MNDNYTKAIATAKDRLIWAACRHGCWADLLERKVVSLESEMVAALVAEHECDLKAAAVAYFNEACRSADEPKVGP